MPATAPVWTPPAELTRDQIVAASDASLAAPDRPAVEREEELRLRVLDLDWDVGGKVFEPADPATIPTGADGKQVGIFLLHGGGGDHRGKEQMARFITAKLGYRVVCMTYPGHLYLDDPSHEWPGDTISPDGTARTPIWKRGEAITPDQYELIRDRSDVEKRRKWGTLFFLRAKEGSAFYHRMAAWPAAFEEAMQAFCRRELPPDRFSVYVHGHSTGGPFVHMLLQRVENVVGLVGMESSPYGSIYGRMLGMTWQYPFTDLTVRTWRHIAKYAGAEAGPAGAWRLPWIMEDVLEAWERARKQPQLKAEYTVTYGAVDTLADAARAVAARLELDEPATRKLVERFTGYVAPLAGPGVPPVPPLLYGIAQGSRDHTPERYRDVVLPTLAALDPAPRTALVQYKAGVHGYEKAEDGLPRGVLPAVLGVWRDAIASGFFVQ